MLVLVHPAAAPGGARLLLTGKFCQASEYARETADKNFVEIEQRLTALLSAGSALTDRVAALEALMTTTFDFSIAGASLSYDGVAKTAALAAGKYLVASSTACHVVTGPQASVVATANDMLIPADTIVGSIIIDATNNAISVIKDAIAGVLYYKRVE